MLSFCYHSVIIQALWNRRIYLSQVEIDVGAHQPIVQLLRRSEIVAQRRYPLVLLVALHQAPQTVQLQHVQRAINEINFVRNRFLPYVFIQVRTHVYKNEYEPEATCVIITRFCAYKCLHRRQTRKRVRGYDYDIFYSVRCFWCSPSDTGT